MKTNFLNLECEEWYASPVMHILNLADDTPVLCVSSQLESFDGTKEISSDSWLENF